MTPEQTIERERRWAPWAGIAGIASFVLFFIGNVVAATNDVAAADTTAEQLRAYQADASGVVLGALLQTAGFIGLGVLTVLLFRAARARWPEMNGSLIGLAVIGPALFVALSLINVVAFSQASDDFSSIAEPELRGKAALEELATTVEEDPESIEEVLFLTESDALEYDPRPGAVVSLSYPAADEQELIDSVEAADIDTDTEPDGEPGELAARNLVADSDAFNTARLLIIPATIALVIAVFYTARSAMRVGLQTRFWGTFGMAAGLATILLGPIGPLIWIVNVGILISGWGSRPPAWDEGRAVPWAAPGEEQQPGDPDEERDEEADAPGAAEREQGGPTQKRKRKRRR